MSPGLENNRFTKLLLKPRFKIEKSGDNAVIIKNFNDEFARNESRFLGKIVDHHIITDVHKDKEHFW